MKNLKLKDPIELMELFPTDDLVPLKPAIEYIEKLHSALRTYQMVFRQIQSNIETHDENIE
jgi:hypothetical protein